MHKNVYSEKNYAWILNIYCTKISLSFSSKFRKHFKVLSCFSTTAICVQGHWPLILSYPHRTSFSQADCWVGYKHHKASSACKTARTSFPVPATGAFCIHTYFCTHIGCLLQPWLFRWQWCPRSPGCYSNGLCCFWLMGIPVFMNES